jgi:Domain of unknown function (DUF4397)
MRRSTLALGGALALAVTLATGSAALAEESAAQETGTVYVVHGVPDTPVDVYVDGERAIDDFQPGTSQGPVDLPAGPHKVAIFPADAAEGSGSPLLSADADLPEGANVALVAHLDADGKPTVTPFKNDVAKVAAGQARLVVRHTAAAPAVDVLAGGKPVIQGLTNPNEEELTVPAGSVSAAVAAAGSTDPVIGPADVDLKEGTATFVHAIGSLQDKSLGLVSFTVSNLHSSPSGVPGGAPSGAPYEPGPPAWVLVLGVTGLAGVLLAARRRVQGVR